MSVIVEINGDTARVVPVGAIDEAGAERLKASLDKIDLNKIKNIELDFRGVPFIGSAGIGKLLSLYRLVAPKGGAVTIINVTQDIYNIFRGTKLTEVFSVRVARS